MRLLRAVYHVGPANAYVAAGAVRNLLWDSFYDPPPLRATADIDVVYFDPSNRDKGHQLAFETALSAEMPGYVWQVRNQARMHARAGDGPYENLNHALSHWPETATAIAVRLLDGGVIDVMAPFGLDDLYNHILRPSPAILHRDPQVFHQRITQKQWPEQWPKVKIIA